MEESPSFPCPPTSCGSKGGVHLNQLHAWQRKPTFQRQSVEGNRHSKTLAPIITSLTILRGKIAHLSRLITFVCCVQIIDFSSEQPIIYYALLSTGSNIYQHFDSIGDALSDWLYRTKPWFPRDGGGLTDKRACSQPSGIQLSRPDLRDIYGGLSRPSRLARLLW
jgi:hypothetical protein